MKKPEDNIISFEDANLPNTQYSIYDSGGNKVTINPKNKEKHTNFPYQDQPVVFRNLGSVVLNYDRKQKSTSKSKEALANRKNGVSMVYERDDYYDLIDMPGKECRQNYKMVVVVSYGYDGNNHTTTYYDKPGVCK